MKAIICMAGEGKRLRPFTANYPKGLIKVGEKTILEYMLDAISEVGLKEVIIVVGYKGDRVKEKIGDHYKDCKIRYIFNNEYALTDNSYSLWLARNYVSDGMIFFNGDIIFDADILREAVESGDGNNLVVDDTIELVDDSMKVNFEEGKLREIGKKISLKPNGWAVGIYRFSKKGAERYFEILEEFFHDGPKSVSFVAPVSMIAKEEAVYVVSTAGRRWVEIDTMEDYEKACGDSRDKT